MSSRDTPPAQYFFDSPLHGTQDKELRTPGRTPDEVGPETEWSAHYGRTEYWRCDVCSSASEDPVWIGCHCICYACSDVAMNVINLRHGGQFLTWPNPERTNNKPKRKGISTRKRRRVYERDAYRCRYCGGYERLEIDHIVPVSQGGDNNIENLATACKECNRRKHANTPEEAGMVLL